MRNTQRSGTLQVLRQCWPMLFLGICNARIAPALDDIPALRHVIHLGKDVFYDVYNKGGEGFRDLLKTPARGIPTGEFHACRRGSWGTNSQAPMIFHMYAGKVSMKRSQEKCVYTL